MKRIYLYVAGIVVALVPAVLGLTGNASFSQSVPVRVPDRVSSDDATSTPDAHADAHAEQHPHPRRRRRPRPGRRGRRPHPRRERRPGRRPQPGRRRQLRPRLDQQRRRQLRSRATAATTTPAPARPAAVGRVARTTAAGRDDAGPATRATAAATTAGTTRVVTTAATVAARTTAGPVATDPTTDLQPSGSSATPERGADDTSENGTVGRQLAHDRDAGPRGHGRGAGAGTPGGRPARARHRAWCSSRSRSAARWPPASWPSARRSTTRST